ncbi:MAG: ABC transporter permease, partial [Candidatus Latescibacteria bacterium]|nr:ABC transporter permease [Candidatus Latescibacterota bacterium]
MLKNYLIVAVRNLLRYKVYSLINVLGLAVGMACCILILLYVQDELNYDRHHEKGDRIYRVLRERHVGTGSSSVNSGISGAMAPALRRDFPEVEQAVRVMDRSAFVRYKDKIFEQRICISEAPILEMFTFPLVEGD